MARFMGRASFRKWDAFVEANILPLRRGAEKKRAGNPWAHRRVVSAIGLVVSWCHEAPLHLYRAARASQRRRVTSNWARTPYEQLVREEDCCDGFGDSAPPASVTRGGDPESGSLGLLDSKRV